MRLLPPNFPLLSTSDCCRSSSSSSPTLHLFLHAPFRIESLALSRVSPTHPIPISPNPIPDGVQGQPPHLRKFLKQPSFHANICCWPHGGNC